MLGALESYIKKYSLIHNMDWKEVFKVSVIVGILTFLAVNSSDYTDLGDFVSHQTFEAVAFLSGILTTGFMLNRKLDKKSDWGILIGVIVTWLVPLVLQLLITLVGF